MSVAHSDVLRPRERILLAARDPACEVDTATCVQTETIHARVTEAEVTLLPEKHQHGHRAIHGSRSRLCVYTYVITHTRST